MRTIWTALVAATLAAGAHAGGAGSAGGEFLGIGAFTRAAAMGEAYTGLADDPGAMFYNPGGLARNRDMSLHYLHAFWLQAIGYDHLSAILPFGRAGTGGVAFTRLFTQADRIEAGGAGEPVTKGQFDASAAGVALGWGMQLEPALAAGVALKAVSQDLAVVKGSAAAVDAGILYRTPLNQLTTGAAISNLGTGLAGASLPVLLRIGAGFALPTVRGVASSASRRGLWDAPLVSLDLVFPVAPQESNFIRVRLGAEYAFALPASQTVAARLGYRFGEQGAGGLQGASAGLGYRMTTGRFRLGVDYALVHYGDLGVTHRIAFTTTFLKLTQVSFRETEEQARASKREGQVFLQWPVSSDPQVTGYNVYMGESKDADFVKVNRTGSVPGTTLSVRGLKIGKTYYFFVTTVIGVEPAIEGRPFFETSGVAQPVP